LAVWITLHFAGDRWWLATMLLFGPRWVWGAPLALLLPAAGWLRPRRWWVVFLGVGIALIPVGGLRVPWRTFTFATSQPCLRVLTCNIHRQQTDTKSLAKLIAAVHPDVVALQNWSSSHAAVFGQGGWFMHRDGELLLASRFPIGRVTQVDQLDEGGWDGSGTCYELQTPWAVVPFFNLHLASPHRYFEDVLESDPTGPEGVRANSACRERQSKLVSDLALAQGPATLLAGDFNTPDDSPIFRRAWASFSDAFTIAGWGFGRTFYTRRTAIRIDHILAGPAWRCRRCWVGPTVGSPHLPVIADIEFVGAR